MQDVGFRIDEWWLAWFKERAARIACVGMLSVGRDDLLCQWPSALSDTVVPSHAYRALAYVLPNMTVP